MAAQSQRAKHAKVRWQWCAIIAEKLDIDKIKFHNYLYQAVKARNWLEQAREGDPLILEEIKKLPEWQRMIDEPPPLQVVGEDEEEYRPHSRWSRNEKKLVEDDPAAHLRVAFWYISKFRTTEDAKNAFDAGVAALRKLERKGDEA